ncbi:hypothetical protein [Amycolatopsis anabasis]|uniref:hypothetical protein n=1 Tax=Amycolatopsis anabasis TaxID=1840409 RepID=UPI00131AA2C3|nr:hypothetical protein [Amycolatopsis anabasis]
MLPAWLTALGTFLGPATGALTALYTARRAVRTARTSADAQALAELHAGYQALLADRANHTRDVLAELAAVKAELSAVRQENARLLLEVGALRAQLNHPPNPRGD